jgi:hypothetical protein
MAKPAVPASLAEVAEFQRREWAVRRAGWIVLWALLAAAAAGLFGRGPLARAQVTAPGGLRVDFERFARKLTPTNLTITIPASAHADTTVLWLDRRYADHMEVQHIKPEPLDVAADSLRLVYRFLTLGGDRPVRVTLQVEPEGSMRLHGRLGVIRGDSASFTQLVYP